MDIENKICDAIEMLVDNSIARADFDRTIQATIVSCSNAITKEYKIKYQDNTLVAYAANDAVYKKDTLVYVLVPNNDLSRQKTILGAVNKESESYLNSVNQNQTYDFIGVNVIKGGRFSLNSYYPETKVLYSYQNDDSQNLIKIDDFSVNEYIKENNTIYCSVDFQTSLPVEQQQYGNYGVIFALDFLNENSEEVITKYYSININNVQGNPYKLLQPTNQDAFFDINNEDFLRLNSISIFVKDFPNKSDSKDKADDIFISNICLQAANKMTSEELSGYSINFITPRGTAFKEDSFPDSVLPIEATVKLKGQEIDISDDNIEFYWFIEDASIKSSSQYYNIYGGSGWKCLNKKDDSGNWMSETNKIDISLLEAISKNNLIKCVAIYSGNIFNKTINIKNYTAANITIVSDTGTTFYYDQGNPLLTCLIDGEERPNYAYIWLQIDDNGITELDNNKSTYQVNIKELNSYATFKCAAIYNNITLGTGSITLTNQRTPNLDYTLKIINGDQVFKYDENGISPSSQVNDIPQVIKPLRLSLVQPNGEEIGEEILKNLKVTWNVPQNNTLIVVKENNLNSTELSFEVSKNYSYQKTNNQITASITYQEKTITASTNFLFLKDGDPGTNGTNYVCKIVPNVTDIEMAPNMIIYDTSIERLNYTPATDSQQWMRAQLWEGGDLIFDGYRSDENFDVSWTVLQNKYDYVTSDSTNLNIDQDTGKIFCDGYPSNSQNPANIIKVTITYNKSTYTAFCPIILVKNENLSYNISVEENSGFKQVIYSSDGKNPQYDKSNPFKIHLFQDNISMDDDPNITYVWNIKGVIYEDGRWVQQNLLEEYTLTDEILNKNEKRFKPSSAYDGQCVTIAVECNIAIDGNIIISIFIPIYYGLNKYGLSALNGWDGNSIQASAEGGFILAPQLGAGRKEEDNSFTGLVIGEVKEGSNSKKDVGLIGYNKGQRSIFLDAETGTAAFGIANQGQVIIDPTEERALIRSGNYQEGKSGMAIDLTTPEIVYGNGNFSVNKNGELNAAIGTLGASDSSKIHIGGTQMNSYIYSGNKISMTANSEGFYLGTDGFSMGETNNGQSAFQINTKGKVAATSLTIQSGSTSSSRIELNGDDPYSQIIFYKNNFPKGYIYGGNSGIEIYGNSDLNIFGNLMQIKMTTTQLRGTTTQIYSNIFDIESETVQVKGADGRKRTAISGIYQLNTPTGRIQFQFNNGILVSAISV